MSAKLRKIQNKLIELQKTGRIVLADIRKSDHQLYKYLVELTFWLLDAKTEYGYLENEYKSLGYRAPKKVEYGINYRPLLVLAFGSDLSDSQIRTYSITLNKLIAELEENPAAYKRQKIKNLIKFIKNTKGALDGLAGNKINKGNDIENELDEDKFDFIDSEAADTDTELGDIQAVNDEAVANEIIVNEVKNKELRRAALLKLIAWLDIHNESDELLVSAYQKAKLKEGIEIGTKDKITKNFSLILAQHSKNGITHVATNYDEKLIGDMLASIMSKRFEVAPKSIRPLFELIQTQCLPQSIADLADKLIDETTLLEGNRKRKYKAHRRVMYRCGTDEFILSPINALSGVVSIVKPFFGLILADCSTDVYMNIEGRDELERKLLRNFEFNLYNVQQFSEPPIPQYPQLDSASHVVHLRHRTIPNDFLNISFWPFYDSIKQPQDQLVIDDEYVFTPTWHAHFDRNEVKSVYYEFLESWFKTKNDRYLKRDSHHHLRVTFSGTDWIIENTYTYGSYDAIREIPIKSISASNNSVSATFKMKDFMPAFKSLADLPICDVAKVNLDDPIEGACIPDEVANYKGGIELEINDDMLCIKFSTYVFGGSEHTIYIPTVDADGERSTKPFKRYFPLITVDNSAANETEDAL
ncbi:MAG: hypothetical protein RLZZ66_2180 [Pseudomonadota bacterium]